MFGYKFQQLLSKIALLAIVFAALAPTVSHALAASNGTGFAQTLCLSNGSKITVQQVMVTIATTQGKQLNKVFDVKQAPAPQANIHDHLEHCPFCGAGAVSAAIPPSTPAWVLLLQTQAKQGYFEQTTLRQTAHFQTAHAPRAPPQL